MITCRSLARFSRLNCRCPAPFAPSVPPLQHFQRSFHQKSSTYFTGMPRTRVVLDESGNHKKQKPFTQEWRPMSTGVASQEADLNDRADTGSKFQQLDHHAIVSEPLTSVGAKEIVVQVATSADNVLQTESSTLEESPVDSTAENLNLQSNLTLDNKVDIEETMKDVSSDKDPEVACQKHSLSVEVDAPLIRFVQGPGGSMQKQIEGETGVKIIFPSSKKETRIVLEGNSAESVTKASEKIATLLEEVVKTPKLDYSHFISLPLAIHPDLVEKLNRFQRSILGDAGSSVDDGMDEDIGDSSDEIDHEDNQAGSQSVSIQLEAQEKKHAKMQMVTKDSRSGSKDLGIDKSIFIKPKTFHLTVLMLKLWNKDRVAAASELLQTISSKVQDALENRPISLRLRGLTCMKGSPLKAKVIYAPVLEVGREGRLERACKVIIDAFVESGLVFERDAKETLKLHATLMNVRHRKRTKTKGRNDSFDARHIFVVYGSYEWGEYHLPEVHLSQRFKFDEKGYYHCCSSITLPEKM